MKKALFLGVLMVVSSFQVHAQGVGAEASASAGANARAGQTGIEVGAEAQIGSQGNDSARQNACEASCRNDYGGSGSAGFDACIRGCGAIGAAGGAREAGTSTPARAEPNEKISNEGGTAASVQHNQSNLDFLTRGAAVQDVEVRGWDPEKKQEFLATVQAYAQVKSGQDLENFAKGVLLKDENVSEVTYDDTEIAVEYKGRGKLLGFIPLGYTHRVTVDTDASASERVKVHFPWYRFLLKTGLDAKEIETEIAANLSADLTAGDTGAKISAYAKAFVSISNVLKTKHDTVKNSIGNVR